MSAVAGAGDHDGDSGAVRADGHVPLRPLSLVEEGGEVLLGDPAAGSFVTIPPVGAVVVRALQDGATVAEARALAEAEAGEPVDVPEFVTVLRELGFVAGDGDSPTPERSAPIQQRRWLTGPRPELVRPLFSPAAWAGYAAAFVVSVACFVLHPSLWPEATDVFVLPDHGLSVLLLLPFQYALVALHEAWHWLAARALGLQARFGIDRRFHLLVFETDLSQLWSVPRRLRYGPQLAGLAIDGVVLACLLLVLVAGERGVLALAPLLQGVLQALVLAKVVTMLWQAMVFMRTDLYGVLVTATRCRNLWEVKSLMLRRAFGLLSPAQAAELDAADPRDRRVGSWFRWVYLAGLAVVACYLTVFFVPILVGLLGWSWQGLASGPDGWRFWWTLAASLLVYLPTVTALWLWLSGLRAPVLASLRGGRWRPSRSTGEADVSPAVRPAVRR